MITTARQVSNVLFTLNEYVCVNFIVDDGIPPVLAACSRGGHIPVLQYLLDIGVSNKELNVLGTLVL